MRTQHILASLLDTEIKKLRDHPDLKAIENLEPSDPAVRGIARRVADVWNVIIDAFPQWEEEPDTAGTRRRLQGGLKSAEGGPIRLSAVIRSHRL